MTVNDYVGILMSRLYDFESAGTLVRICPGSLLDDLSLELAAQTGRELNEVKSQVDYALEARLGNNWQYEIYEILDGGKATLDDESYNFEALIY